MSRTRIAFVEAGQLWVMPRGGGLATRVSSLPGRKFTPRFSPDGQSIAFSSNEAQGELNIYVMSLNGGTAKRITFIPSHQNLTQWTNDNRLLFYTNSLCFSPIEMQIFAVSSSGGLPTMLPVAYGSDGVIDDSGEWLAYTPNWHNSLYEDWARYRGGAAQDIWLVNLRTHASRRITDWAGGDLRPMWHGDTLYYLSDEGPEERMNVWSYEMRDGSRKQVTHFRDYDIRNASIGPDAIMFELGPDLELLDLNTATATPIQTEIPERPSLERDVDDSNFITNRQLSKDGTHVLMEARGDLWLASVGPQATPPRNLTATSGAFEREASLSPDGKKVAYWSDASGEYQLYVRDIAAVGSTKPLTRFTNGFRFRPAWSPDSRRLAFADQRGAIVVFDVARRRMTPADTEPWAEPTELAWSDDSKWLAYTRTEANRLTAIWRYDTESGKRQRLTTERFNSSTPVFAPDGERMFFISYRNFSNPARDWIQQRIIHRGLATLMAVPLKNLEFNAESFERAAVRLGTTQGSITGLGVSKDGDPVYAVTDLTGASSVRRYDMQKQEEVTIKDAQGVTLSPDGGYLLIDREGKAFVSEISGSSTSAVNMTGMIAKTNLLEEWRELYLDSWRYYRDYFYAPRVGLAGWDNIRTRYLPMIDRCLTRQEVNLVLGEMIGECSVGHAYIGNGGDVGPPLPPGTVGMPGADFALENGAFRITRIYEGAAWDDRYRSPLREAKVGEYLLAVNGKPIDIGNDPRAAFVGMAGKDVQVTIGPHPKKDSGSREITIKPLTSENDLRRRAWIEANRKHIKGRSGGRIGYIHAPDYNITGFNEFESQFSGQIDKDALIIDARWSTGGWTGAILAENMARPPLTFQAIRESDQIWPAQRWGAHFGPKAVLVNYITVSAGEAFCYFFRKLGLGPLVGSRTWGGSTGLNTVPSLIDGGYVNVPDAPFYDETGWLWEGEGLDPDVLVEPDPAKMVTEGDAQLDAAIDAMLKALATKPFHPPEKPH